MPRIGEIAERPDLRMPLLGLAAWVGALVAHAVPGTWLLGGAAAVRSWAVALVRRRGRAAAATVVAVLLVAGAVAGVTWLRTETVHRSPVADLAQERAVVSVIGRVVRGPADGRGSLRASGGGAARRAWGHRARQRAEPARAGAGDRRRRMARRTAGCRRCGTSGRLAPADDDDLAGVLVGARRPGRWSRDPDVWWRAAGAVRRSIRESVAGRPIEQRALVPALVDRRRRRRCRRTSSRTSGRPGSPT